MSKKFKHKPADYSSHIPQKYMFDFKGDQDFICGRFGCGRTLSLREQMFGKYCVVCSGQVKVDITKIIKFK